MQAEQSCSSSNPDGTVRSFANQRGQQHRCANSPTGLQGWWCGFNKTPEKLSERFTEWHTAVHLADALQLARLHCLDQGHFRTSLEKRGSITSQSLPTQHIFNPFSFALSDFIIVCRLVSVAVCLWICLSIFISEISCQASSPMRRGDKKVAEVGWTVGWEKHCRWSSLTHYMMIIFNPLYVSKIC